MSAAFEHIAVPTKALGRYSQSHKRLMIFGDHSSKHIPDEYDNLGLKGDDLTRHIAWDIGTETIIRSLCAHFGCIGQLAGVSRLVIDLNRDLGAAGLIPEISDGSPIVGNQGLTPAQRQDRVERFYAPYHAALAAALNALFDPFILSVHSFTPQPLTGTARDTEIGLLVKHDVQTAEQFQQSFASSDYKVEINKPYSAYDLNYTIDKHIGPRGLRHLAIEIRQDLVDTPEGCAAITALLIDRLEVIMENHIKA